jgi:hypothetical protein
MPQQAKRGRQKESTESSISVKWANAIGFYTECPGVFLSPLIITHLRRR